MENLYGQMEVCIRGTSLIITCMEKACISGTMEGCIKGSGIAIKCMDKGDLTGLMGGRMWVSIIGIRNTARVFSLGRMEGSIMARG